MNDSAQAVLLDHYLGTALSASNDLVAMLCEQMGDLGLSDDERRVLLLLWTSDGLTEAHIATRLHTMALEPTLEALERKALVARAESDGEQSVWLTAQCRGMWKLCGTEEMSSRLGRLRVEIVALRDVLQRTVGLLTDATSSGMVTATA